MAQPRLTVTKQSKKIQSPLRVGNAVFIRTVTHYATGRIVSLTRDEIVLTEAAWIACTKRWHTSLTTGELEEVEPFPGPVSIGRGAVVDVCDWTHPLPREPK